MSECVIRITFLHFAAFLCLLNFTRYIIYLGPMNVYVTPSNATVVENSSIVLSCNCGCPIRPRWFKNNQSIRYDGRRSPYTMLSNGSLRIDVSRDTAGSYSCEIRSASWVARSKQIKLEVLCKYASSYVYMLRFLGHDSHSGAWKIVLTP